MRFGLVSATRSKVAKASKWWGKQDGTGRETRPTVEDVEDVEDVEGVEDATWKFVWWIEWLD